MTTVSPLAWLIILMFALVMYAVLGGCTVGLGIALLMQRAPARRATAEVIGSAWDGNETWLILVAIGLWAGFPDVFGILMPHLFVPTIVMLLAIAVRGVSIEMATSTPRPTAWLWILGASSVVIVAAQGLMLGATTQVIPTQNGAYAGNAMQFFSPFPVLTAITLVLIATVEGLAFLRFKAVRTDLAARAGRQGRVVAGFAAPMAVVTALSLQATPGGLRFDGPLPLALWIGLVVVVVIAGVIVWWSFPRITGSPGTTFAWMVTAIIVGWMALIVGRAPLLLPPDYTAENSASPTYSIDFLIVGVGLSIPLLIIYNWHSYSAFRRSVPDYVRDRPPGRSLTSAVLTPPARLQTGQVS